MINNTKGDILVKQKTIRKDQNTFGIKLLILYGVSWNMFKKRLF